MIMLKLPWLSPHCPRGFASRVSGQRTLSLCLVNLVPGQLGMLLRLFQPLLTFVLLLLLHVFPLACAQDYMDPNIPTKGFFTNVRYMFDLRDVVVDVQGRHMR